MVKDWHYDRYHTRTVYVLYDDRIAERCAVTDLHLVKGLKDLTGLLLIDVNGVYTVLDRSKARDFLKYLGYELAEE